jgi:hypothetical protein
LGKNSDTVHRLRPTLLSAYMHVVGWFEEPYRYLFEPDPKQLLVILFFNPSAPFAPKARVRRGAWGETGSALPITEQCRVGRLPYPKESGRSLPEPSMLSGRKSLVRSPF